MYTQQKIANPQQSNSMFDPESSKTQGVSSIIQRFKTNSQIVKFSNWFGYFQSKNKNKNSIQFSSEVLYCGNASDLWGLLAFQIKNITSALAEESGDSNVFRRMIDVGQLFMLYLASLRIQDKGIKKQIQKFYLDKLVKYQLQTDVPSPKRKNQQKIKYKSTLSDMEKKISKNYIWILDFLSSISFQEQKIPEIVQNLKKILKKLISIVKRKFIQEELNKIEIRIIFICIQLLFVLKNMQWKKLCLSEFLVSDHLIKYLGQTNGALKIAKYLHDANPKILNNELQKFYLAISIKNV